MSRITKAAAAILCLTSLGICSGYSQISVSGDLELFISGQIDGLPSAGSGVYANPTEEERATWLEALSLFYSNELATAHETFLTLDYRIIEFEDIESGILFHIICRVSAGTNYWGTYIYNSDNCRQLVLQAPHPKYDTNTGHQALYSFMELSARAFFVSGTHRCSSNEASECSGTTTACGSSAAFKISDGAHNDQSIFHLMTSLHYLQYDEDVFIQFHGFGKQSSDPNAILSNGTRSTPDTDYIELLIDEIKKDDPSLEFRVAHQDLSWTRLVAFTNTQGRLLNQSEDPCLESAELASGHFIHIEQEKDIFRANQSGWDKWIGPLSRVFPCQSVVLHSATFPSATCFPNPFQEMVGFQVSESAAYLEIYSVAGNLQIRMSPDNWKAINMEDLQQGVYLYRICDKNGKMCYTGKMIKN